MPQIRATQRNRQTLKPIDIPSGRTKQVIQSNGPYRIPDWQNSPPQIDLPGPDEVFRRTWLGSPASAITHTQSERSSQTHLEADELTGCPDYMRAPSPSSFPAPPLDWGFKSDHTKASTCATTKHTKFKGDLSPNYSYARDHSPRIEQSAIPDFMRAPSPSDLPAPTFDWPRNVVPIASPGASSVASSTGSDGSVAVLVTSAFGGAQVVCPRPSRPIQLGNASVADWTAYGATDHVRQEFYVQT
ncbi:hypothetical protein PENSPDRAFT_652066 [Peniophora sp. CONT]|nr:hypothetical protein PENSPDRAFT_652066 [Peniophora sp. CONT]